MEKSPITSMFISIGILLITSIFISIEILVVTVFETKQPNMNNNYWDWRMGMDWGVWLIPILIILVILYFVRFRRKY